MNKLLKKELRLTAAPITYFFLAFALMTLIPGYPILVGGFFITLGIFYTFQMARESNDILYTALLPCKKQDVVRAKYFCVLIELLGWLLCAVLTAVRLTALREAAVYTKNAMMNANFAYLGWLLILFALFNSVFLGVFFRTAYGLGKPFIRIPRRPGHEAAPAVGEQGRLPRHGGDELPNRGLWDAAYRAGGRGAALCGDDRPQLPKGTEKL